MFCPADMIWAFTVIFQLLVYHQLPRKCIFLGIFSALLYVLVQELYLNNKSYCYSPCLNYPTTCHFMCHHKTLFQADTYWNYRSKKPSRCSLMNTYYLLLSFINRTNFLNNQTFLTGAKNTCSGMTTAMFLLAFA